jgi:hypothetical protein
MIRKKNYYKEFSLDLITSGKEQTSTWSSSSAKVPMLEIFRFLPYVLFSFLQLLPSKSL